MVVVQITSLAHTHGVKQPIGVFAFECILIPTVLPVAGTAHILGVVFPVHVWALGDLHNGLLSLLYFLCR